MKPLQNYDEYRDYLAKLADNINSPFVDQWPSEFHIKSLYHSMEYIWKVVESLDNLVSLKLLDKLIASKIIEHLASMYTDIIAIYNKEVKNA